MHVGVVSLLGHASGVLEYTRSAIQLLELIPELEGTVFVPRGSTLKCQRFRVVECDPPSRWRRALAYELSILGWGASWVLTQPERVQFSGIDVFFCPYAGTYPHLFLRTPFVFTLHDLQERYHPEFFSRAQRLDRRLLNRALLRRATAVFCESRFVKADIMRFFGTPERKVRVIALPPMATFSVTPPDSAGAKRFSVSPDYFFFPSQFWKHKNHARLLVAFERLARERPTVDLVLTGRKEYEYEHLRTWVDTHALSARVHFLGYLPSEDVRALYANARALVMPSLFESISIPVFEAFAIGTPVLCSNVVGLPEQVGDAGLLFDPTDVEAIYRAMRRILDVPELSADLVEKGAARLRAYDRPATARAFFEALREAA